MKATTQDRIVAYQMAIDALPRADRWSAAIAARTDGSSVAGVFAVIDRLKMEYQGCIGALAEGEAAPRPARLDINATAQDTIVGYQLAIDSLPRGARWEHALSLRTDGSTPSGVVAALDALRMSLHVRLGDLMEDLTLGIHEHA